MEVIAKTGQSGRTWSIRAALKLLWYVSNDKKKIACAVMYVLQIITLSPACRAVSVTSKGSLSHARLYCNLFPSRYPLTL